VIVNRAGHIMSVNPRGEQMFGYAKGDLIGQLVELLLPERFREVHRGHRAAYLADPRSRSMGVGVDLFGRRKPGTEFPIEISLSPIETTQGLLAMALVTDITERRRFERTAREHEKLAALATLSAGIAHELNNPIGVIATRVELMVQDAASWPLPDEVVEDLCCTGTFNASPGSQRACCPSRGRGPKWGPVNINGVIEETLLLLGRQLGNDGVQVSVTLDHALDPIRGMELRSSRC
jgi:PAS domain S-box-containing protein